MLQKSLVTMAAATFAAGLAAQVPDGYLVLTKRSGAENGVYMVDPSTGVESRVFSRASGSTTLTDGIGVCLEPTSTNRIFATGSDGGFGFGANYFALLFVGENNVTPNSGKRTVVGFPGFTFPREVERIGASTLLTVVSGGTNNGLWTIDVITNAGASALLLPFATDGFAKDVAVVGNTAYLVTEQSSTGLSGIFAWDSLLNTTSTIASGLAPDLKCIGFHGGRLLVGTATGDILEVDTGTGMLTPFLATGLGLPVTEIASKGGAGDPIYIVIDDTSEDRVYDTNDLANPVYTYAGEVRQIAVGIDLQAAALAFGEGCDSAAMVAPHHRYINQPSLGNAGFQIGLGDAPAAAPTVLHIGASRTTSSTGPLPIDLTAIGMTGCFLYTEPIAIVPAVPDAMGNASVAQPIPADLSLTGARLFTQWAMFDAGANPLNVIASDGCEWIVK